MFFHKNGIAWMISNLQQIKLLIQRYERYGHNFFNTSHSTSPDFENFKNSVAELTMSHNTSSLYIMRSDAENVVKHLVDGDQQFHEFIKGVTSVRPEKDKDVMEGYIKIILDEKRRIIESCHGLQQSLNKVWEEIKKLNECNQTFKPYDIRELQRSLGEAYDHMCYIRNSSEKIAQNVKSIQDHTQTELNELKKVREEAGKTHWVFANIESWFKTS